MIIGFRFNVFLLLFPVFVQAQNYREDVEHINKRYAQMKKFSMELEYKFYPTYQSTQVGETNIVLMKRDNKNFYYNYFGTESLMNNKYTVVVNHSNKLVFIDYSQKKDSVDRKKFKGYQMDSIFNSLTALMSKVTVHDSLLSTISEKMLGDNLKQYTIACTRGDYTSFAFVFNTKSYQLEKAILYFRKTIKVNENATASAPRIEIEYKKINTKPRFPKQTFSEEAFLSVSNDGKLSVKPVLSRYKIINQLTTN